MASYDLSRNYAHSRCSFASFLNSSLKEIAVMAPDTLLLDPAVPKYLLVSHDVKNKIMKEMSTSHLWTVEKQARYLFWKVEDLIVCEVMGNVVNFVRVVV